MKALPDVYAAQLELLGPFMQQQLRLMALDGTVSPTAALHHVFVTLYGDGRSPHERRLFLSFAAPLARRA